MKFRLFIVEQNSIEFLVDSLYVTINLSIKKKNLCPQVLTFASINCYPRKFTAHISPKGLTHPCCYPDDYIRRRLQ